MFAEIKLAILKAARKTIVLADHSKFNRLFPFIELDKVDAVITDSKLSKEDQNKYEQKGLNIITCEADSPIS